MRRLAMLTVAVLAAAIAMAGPALAHVTVSAPGAARGGSDQEITFRVPDEKDVATVGLAIALPTSTPIASVLVQASPGWTHTQKTVRLAHPIETDDGAITTVVSQIAWHAAAGGGIRPGEYGEFTILAGRLPDAPSITFRALQYYADGSVVPWNQVAAPGSTAVPGNPAPVLRLAASGGLEYGSSPLRVQAREPPSNAGPYAVSIIALVLAAAALGGVVVNRAKKSAT